VESPVATVQIWLVRLDHLPAETVAASVSGQEISRAAAFADPRLRAHYLAAHAALRCVLSAFVATPPQALVFATGDFGKPFLAQQHAPRFNLSHSENWALIGVSEAGNGQPALELGVDVEAWRDLPDAAGMLAHIGSATELAGLENNPAKLHASQPMLDLWTRKEACMKAVGYGLQWDPRSIEVGPTRHKTTLEVFHQGRLRRLCVASLDLSRHGLSAAVAQLQANSG
jgi:4'-phosphopantetheinyl transferase